jgi:hypothetical protein
LSGADGLASTVVRRCYWCCFPLEGTRAAAHNFPVNAVLAANDDGGNAPMITGVQIPSLVKICLRNLAGAGIVLNFAYASP